MTTADTLKAEEGWRKAVYSDTRGVLTLGYGFNVDPEHGGEIPRPVADFWVDWKLSQITEQLTERWPPFSAQPVDVQEALKEMAYQMGVDGVLGFRLMLGALERGDRHTAATEALDSGWSEQTPARASRVAARLRGA